MVSNFNGERYLPRLLDSLAAQEGVVTEVLVVHRHSTDRSGDILASRPEDLYLAERCLRSLACHIDPDRRVGAADPWQWTYDAKRPKYDHEASHRA